MLRLLLFVSAVAIAAVPAICAALPPSPEPYFGRYGAVCPSPDTSGANVLGKFESGPDPAAEEQARVVEDYVAAIVTGKDATSIVSGGIPTRTQTSCASALAKLTSADGCASEPLQLLGDGEIRQVWICKGQTAYVMFYTVETGKLTNIWSLNTPPVVAVRKQ